jgi:hypothetical protein
VRRAFLATLAALTTFALGATLAPAAISPANGIYQGTAKGTPTTNGHNEGEGYFAVKVINGGKKIVPACNGQICVPNITAPSDFTCNAYNAAIQAARIPVAGGAFDYRGTAPIGRNGARRNIHFKGHWVAAKKLVGFTQISGGGCSHKDLWTMKSPPPF